MTGPLFVGERYEFRGALGTGGFATVYRAWDTALHREVAFKSLLPYLTDDAGVRRRFLAEARALAGLRHPNIVTVHDIGEFEGRPYFTMELIDGETLAEKVVPGRGLPIAEVAGSSAILARCSTPCTVRASCIGMSRRPMR